MLVMTRVLHSSGEPKFASPPVRSFKYQKMFGMDAINSFLSKHARSVSHDESLEGTLGEGAGMCTLRNRLI